MCEVLFFFWIPHRARDDNGWLSFDVFALYTYRIDICLIWG